MKPKSIAIGLLALTCIAAGWQLRSWYPPADVTQNQEIDPAETELEQLHTRIAQLETALAAAIARNSVLQITQAKMQLPEPTTDTEEPEGHAPASASRSSIPELEALTAAQIPLSTAEAIRSQIGQNRMAMLRLRDQAEREGWINTTRYALELRKLLDPAQGIRERFGEDIYDRYLYASGLPNRVIAVAVYPNSTAAAGGIQAGDVVLSYASKNIYAMNDLQQATREGQAGESVLVVLQRDESTFSITLPRGPLGIELKMKTWAPEY